MFWTKISATFLPKIRKLFQNLTMDSLAGAKLVKGDGSTVPAEEVLANKVSTANKVLEAVKMVV